MIEYLILAYAPALFIMWYVYHKDRIEPEPKRYVVATFLIASTVSPLIAMIFEAPFPQELAAFVAPFIEEPAKLLAVYFPYRRRQMDGIMDGVVYGVAAGLGFAAFENLMYGISYGSEVAMIRAFLTPIAHSTFTALSGVGLGLKAEGKTLSVKPYLAMAMMFHLWWNVSAVMSFMTLAMFAANLAVLYSLIRLGMREDVQKIEYYIMRRKI
ncbi:Protease prsW family [Geoglobus ahangari]|uniref:Protease prsW family n=1 Tax=Geoglobus ahangari TaxID=113653 RepID=A0A0F7DB95_9EURY|nr:PrsW family glutamic-type intramembrane protease [Geoglobus ahangari]AKG90701.1 Protease prsW family [Geoglobus ahangari]NOY10831.1 PrsW family intramembrane metalloprotease [Archaeoglobi archaeon]